MGRRRKMQRCGREAGSVTYALVAVGGFVLAIVVVANLMATVALIRTSRLTRFQTAAQGVIVWVLRAVAPFESNCYRM
jgi:hypothetical protein